MMMNNQMITRFSGFLLLNCLIGFTALFSQVPEGFKDQLVLETFEWIVQTDFDDNGRIYLTDKAGRIHIFEDGKLLEEPLIDIAEEVLHHSDHGLLSMALHPNFLQNGYFYLLYVVDAYYLLNSDKSDYDPTITWPDQATIGRLTRYTADKTTNFKTVLEGSRKVLIGDNPNNGLPILHKSHGVGDLVFGTDGTLLISVGDGASYVNTGDFGSHDDSFWSEALEREIITEVENVGAYRSQLISSYNGKIMRIDPLTGEGLPSNPFFNEEQPASVQSRIWALGFRNPFRFTKKPGTGSHNAEDGDPGVFYVGDVGWGHWEEVNVLHTGGQNFGWPIYEGMYGRWNYGANKRENKLAPNPLFGQGGCDAPFLSFHDLIVQDREDKDITILNPCNDRTRIPEEIPQFVHSRPMLSWSNREFNLNKQGAELPGYDNNGDAVVYDLGSDESPASGESFNGSCAVGGAFVTGKNFPTKYQQTYLFGDYLGFMKKMDYDPNDRVLALEGFMEEVDEANVVDMTISPDEGCLYYIRYRTPKELRKVCFGGNAPPISQIKVDQNYGPSPLTLSFLGDESIDPEGDSLKYEWNFGDGNTSNEKNPQHTFVASNSSPESFQVSLTVEDAEGAKSESEMLVSLNNSPPEAKILSFEDGDRYIAGKNSVIPLVGEANDQEHNELQHQWQVFLHHNTHFHADPFVEAETSSAKISGEGCGSETYWYRVNYTVTDPEGLYTTVSYELFPFCETPSANIRAVEAYAEEEGIFINYEVLTQQAGTRYQMERAGAEDIFQPIGQPFSAQSQVLLQFQDTQPLDGQNSYRVRILGQENILEYSNAVRSDFPPPPSIRLFPNPIQDLLNITFRRIQEPPSIRIFDLFGKQILVQTGDVQEIRDHNWQIELSSLAPGLYIYAIEHGTKQYVGKLIRQ